MKRLTFDGNFCDIAMCQETQGGSFCEDGYCSQRKVWERLKQYEDAEEQGLLVRLPCKVGGTVYVIGQKYRAGQYEKWINTGRFNLSDLDKLGKTVFTSREAAEKALEDA